MKIAILGPISAWWDEAWETPEHWAYVEWRDKVHDALVAADHLVYRPDRTWKGTWEGNEDAQIVNDKAIEVCDLELNLTPPGVRSVGTEDEMLLCERLGKPVVMAPPDDRPDAIERLMARINAVTPEALAAGAMAREDDVLVSRDLLVAVIDALEQPDTFIDGEALSLALTRLRTAIRHSTPHQSAVLVGGSEA